MQHSESDDEPDDYWLARYKAARHAGLTRVEARWFADGTATLKVLREMRAAGARPEQIARIVR